MLVLARYPGDRVVINDNVIVEVIEVRGDRVRLGFTAPRGTPIRREEVMRVSDTWKAEELVPLPDDDERELGGEGRGEA